MPGNFSVPDILRVALLGRQGTSRPLMSVSARPRRHSRFPRSVSRFRRADGAYSDDLPHRELPLGALAHFRDRDWRILFSQW